MNNKENLMKLKERLINHKSLFLKWGELDIVLIWDNEEKCYFGKTDDIDACRWTIKTLWCIANRQWENAKLYEKKEEEQKC